MTAADVVPLFDAEVTVIVLSPSKRWRSAMRNEPLGSEATLTAPVVQTVYDEAHRVLEPGGMFVAAVPNAACMSVGMKSPAVTSRFLAVPATSAARL